MPKPRPSKTDNKAPETLAQNLQRVEKSTKELVRNYSRVLNKNKEK